MMVAVPCAECGGELYNSVAKYHLKVPCADPKSCSDVEGHWSYGSYCPHCHAQVATARSEGLKMVPLDQERLAAERVLLFG